MNTLKTYGPLVGRILISLIFIIAGYHKIGGFEQVAGYMASQGLPAPKLLLALTILIEIGGGLMILTGFHARCAALVFFFWLIPVTLTFHAFWAASPDQATNQFNNFMKNVAIMGAMVYIMVHGSGPLSVTRQRF